MILALGLGTVVTASAGMTRRWALNEYTLDGGILESVSGSTAGALFGDATGVIGNPGATAADRAYLFKGNTANNAGNAVSTEITNVLPATGSFSVFVTAKFATNYQGGGRLLFSNNNSQGGRIDFAIDGNATTPNRLTFFYGGTTSMSISFNDSVATPILFDGGWHEVGIARSGTSYQLYVDGVARGTAGTSSLAISTTTVYRIGRRTAFSGFFNNAISEVQVFDEARTAGLPLLAYDSDSDNIADSWEIRYFAEAGEDPVADLAAILTRCDPGGDSDSDTLDNLGEFNARTNPNLADTDNDGLSDKVENNSGSWTSGSLTGTNPLKPDSDGDGLLDGQENNGGVYVSVTDTGTNPNLADTDGDTFNDYLEISRGSDPVVVGSTPGAFSSTPLVALDAGSLAVGPLPAWTNTGTLGRGFTADSEPVVETIGGVKGVTFSGIEVLTGPVASSNLTGSSPRTIEAWIFNPTTSSEETIVAWGRRDGPNGTSCGFFHGTNTGFGAVGNWGTPDMAWGPDAAAIATNVKLGSWTHVVYTYDGTEGRLYSNGTVAYTEILNALATFGIDNTAAARPLPIRVAGQNAANGTLATAGQKGSLTIAKLRIHDRVVSAADLGFNDSDSDGMKDWYEDFYGLNKAVNDAGDDPDADGLTNLEEQSAGTHPNLPDTDADGMSDGWEFDNFGNQSALPTGDADNDGSTNLEEYQATQGLLITRNEQGDVSGLTPFSGRSDPNNANSQPDSDTDGLPDGWEFLNFAGLTATAGEDSDADTFSNLSEFMAGSDPDDVLSTPSDTDADGLADSWEIEKFGGKTAQNGNGDPDADGSRNLDEFTSNTNPNDPDSQPNTDGDHLPDGYEYIHFGDLDEVDGGDFDLDTFGNLAERSAGSNPARRANTPDNVNATTRVAVAGNAGLDEYTVTDGTWTFARNITTMADTLQSVTFLNGWFYGTVPSNTRRIVRIDPTSGAVTDLAVRNTGDALTAGWIGSDPQGIEVGPDGKLYFSTAFGNAGEGVFRLNVDGTGFEKFINRSGTVDHDLNPETPDESWDLNNSRDLEWVGNDLYVSARGGFGATGRPVYHFDAAGGYVGTLTTSLTSPQGLELEQDGLLVTGTNSGTSALVLLDLTQPLPLTPLSRAGASTIAAMDVIDLNGDTYQITYNSGAGGLGQVMRRNFNGTFTTVVEALPSNGNDLCVFALTNPDTDGDGLPDAWENTNFGNLDQTAAGDPDGDGSRNLVEFLLGLDPNDGAERFAASVAGTPAAGLTLTWPSQPGLTFTVRSSTDLTDWTTVEATLPAADAPATTTSWTSGPLVGPRRFFRVEFTQ